MTVINGRTWIEVIPRCYTDAREKMLKGDYAKSISVKDSSS